MSILLSCREFYSDDANVKGLSVYVFFFFLYFTYDVFSNFHQHKTAGHKKKFSSTFYSRDNFNESPMFATSNNLIHHLITIIMVMAMTTMMMMMIENGTRFYFRSFHFFKLHFSMSISSCDFERRISTIDSQLPCYSIQLTADPFLS